MKSKNEMYAALFLVFAATGLKAQSDIGIRICSHKANHTQIEFRKPLNELCALRLSASLGSAYRGMPESKGLLFEDSLTIYKNIYSDVTSAYDLRLGVERKLKWNLLSVHSDLVIGYHRQQKYSRTTYFVIDEDGSDYYTLNADPEVPQWYITDPQLAWGNWTAHYVSAGIAAGVSLDVPFYRFVLGVNVQGVGSMNIPVVNRSHDPANDFGNVDAIKYTFYPSTGVALRYQLGSKNR